jgi:hypothetical protein
VEEVFFAEGLDLVDGHEGITLVRSGGAEAAGG